MSTTYAVAKTKVEKDLDLEGEEFIQDSEMLAYFNDALRDIEKDVLTIYEDYLLDKVYLPLIFGQDTYSLPAGIFSLKMRAVIYNSGSILYEIKRNRTQHKFLDRAFVRTSDPLDYYQYIVLNNSTTGIKLELSPPSRETSSANVTVFFIRTVDEIVDDGDFVDKDIPEALSFIYAYVKGKCKQKENRGSMPPDAQAEIDREKEQFIATLTNSIPDDDNEVIKDLSFYNEIS